MALAKADRPLHLGDWMGGVDATYAKENLGYLPSSTDVTAPGDTRTS
jgi:hypothetical protein